MTNKLKKRKHMILFIANRLSFMLFLLLFNQIILKK